MAVTLLVGAAVAVGSKVLSNALAPQPPSIGELDDVAVQRSELGVPIPKVYGKYRVPGNVFWSTNLQKKTQSGSKGLFSRTPDQVRYLADCAVVFAQECYEFGSIWLGNRYIGEFDGTGTQAEIDIKGNKYVDRIYANRGGNVDLGYNRVFLRKQGENADYPVMINRACLTFDEIEVSQQFGGSIPAIEAEIIGQATTPTLEFVVSDVLQIAGIDANRIDVSALNNRFVYGAKLDFNGGSIRDFLDDLSRLYLFSLYEDDSTGVIKAGYNNLIGTPVILDMIQVDTKEVDSEQVVGIQETKAQKTELPSSIELVYKNRLNNYKTGSQRIFDQRIKHINDVRLSTDIVLSDSEAATIVRRIYESYRTQQNTYTGITTTLDYAYLQPDDVIAFELGTRLITAKINKKVIGVNGIVEFDATSVAPAVEDINEARASDNDYTPNTTLPDTQIQPIMLDIPHLIENPITDLVLHYTGREDAEEDVFFDGVLLAESPTFELSAISNIFELSPVGTLRDDLIAPNYHNVIHKTSIVVENATDVFPANDDVGFYDNSYLLYINGEILGYLDSQVDVNDDYTITTLIRGLRGTQDAVQTHLAGSEVYLIKSPALSFITVPYTTNIIGQTMTTYIQHDDQVFEDIELTDDLLLTASSLKPYSPVHLETEAKANGDIDVTWVRRTRKNGTWLDNSEIVPLNEDSEQYRIFVYDGAVPITSAVVANPTFTITSAIIASEGITQNTELTYEVQQFSALYGYGDTLTATTKITKLEV